MGPLPRSKLRHTTIHLFHFLKSNVLEELIYKCCATFIYLFYFILTTHWNKQKNHPNKLLTYLKFLLLFLNHTQKQRLKQNYFLHFYELLLLLLLLKQNVHPNSPHAHIPALIHTIKDKKHEKKKEKRNL